MLTAIAWNKTFYLRLVLLSCLKYEKGWFHAANKQSVVHQLENAEEVDSYLYDLSFICMICNAEKRSFFSVLSIKL